MMRHYSKLIHKGVNITSKYYYIIYETFTKIYRQNDICVV